LFEENGEGIRAVETRVGRGGVHRGGIDEESGAKDTDQSGDGRVNDAALGTGAVEGLGDEQDDAEKNNQNFEVERIHQFR